jgi:ABC-type uncharacterized transport system involved in gliding motility auxiliary subunit
MTTELQTQRNRVAKTGLGNGLFLLILAGVAVMLNLVSTDLYGRLDLTGDQRFTLAPASKKLVSDLGSPVEVKVFLSGELPPPYDSIQRELSDLLSEFAANGGGNFRFTIVDPGASEEDKEKAANYGIRPVTVGEQSSDALSVREVFMGLAIVYQKPSGDVQEVIPQVFPGMNYEYELTRRIRKISSETEIPTVGFVIGDGSFFDTIITEAAKQGGPEGQDPAEAVKTQLAGQLKSQLFDDLFSIEWVTLDKPVADTIDGLVLLGPTKDLGAEGAKNLDAFVMKGKGVAIFQSPYRSNSPDIGVIPGMPKFTVPEENKTGLEGIIESYGVTLNKDTLIDRQSPQVSVVEKVVAYMGNEPLKASVPTLDPRLPLMTNINRKSLLVPNVNLLAFMPAERATPLPISSLSRTAASTAAVQAGTLTITEVVSSAETTVKRTNAMGLSVEDATEEKPDEVAGPFPVIVTIEGKLASSVGNGSTDKARIVVASNGDFISNVFNRNDPLADPRTLRGMPPALGQSVQEYRESAVNFLKNATEWLVSDADLIAIRGRGSVAYIDGSRLDSSKKFTMQAFNIVGIPVLFRLAGLVAWQLRKGRRAALAARFKKAA